MPLSVPIKGNDGIETTKIYVPKGCTIGISIIGESESIITSMCDCWPHYSGANRNTAVWGPDALEWKPERWSTDLPNSVSSLPSAGIFSNL